MKKLGHKKLRVSKETLTNLSPRELIGALGGLTTRCTGSSGTSSSCTDDTCVTCFSENQVTCYPTTAC